MVKIDLVKIPLPGLGIDKVNLYVVENKYLIDAGFYNIISFHELIRKLRSINIRLCDIEAVLITHFHVDHLSLAPVLKDFCEPDFYIGDIELKLLRDGADLFVKNILEEFIRQGVPETEIKRIVDSHPVMRLAEIYKRDIKEISFKNVSDGDEIDNFIEVVSTPGHTPGSVSYKIEDFIFSGDSVLPTITPSVIYNRYSENPLKDHLNTLRKIISINPKAIYPGHGDVINDPVSRAEELIEFHKNRLEEILTFLNKNDYSLYEITKLIKWRVRYNIWEEFPYPERFFALGEALAHLIYLRSEGLVDYYEKNGMIYWYSKAR
jgi:glyoxylase-like metal-dependent hydrolase (beta-lactamase superfamily II)